MTYGVSKKSAIFLVVAGLFGLLASFTLTYDVLQHSANAGYVPPCSLNPILSCVSVMDSEPSTIIADIPNSLFGVIGFSMLIAFAVLLANGQKVSKIIWQYALLAATIGFGTVHYLIYESIFKIQSLCPWCMVVWIVTPLIFFITLQQYLRLSKQSSSSATVKYLQYRYIPLFVWYAAVFLVVGVKFWHYWQTLLP